EDGNIPDPAPEPAARAAAHSYLTPTPEEFQKAVTRGAPLLVGEKTGEPTRLAVSRRPALESRAEVEKALEACRRRPPRLPLAPGGQATAVVSSDLPE